jgi:hypothetical protein
MVAKEMKQEDRVKRKNGLGCLGTVKMIREETTKSQNETPMDALLVKVLWDNGTFSYFAPSALEVVQAA